MTTQTQALYSRPIPFSEATALPGDQINTTPDGFRPHWQTLVWTGPCDDVLRRMDGVDCDGGCAMVLQLEPVEEYDATFWHVDWADYASVLTRLPVDGVK